MSELSLAQLRVLTDFVVGDFIKWVKSMPPGQLTNYRDAQRCPVALYINAHVDPHVVADHIVIENILVHIDDVWAITHVAGTPINNALNEAYTYGELDTLLVPLTEAMPLFDEGYKRHVDYFSVLFVPVLERRRRTGYAVNGERNDVLDDA